MCLRMCLGLFGTNSGPLDTHALSERNGDVYFNTATHLSSWMSTEYQCCIMLWLNYLILALHCCVLSYILCLQLHREILTVGRNNSLYLEGQQEARRVKLQNFR